uniref:Chromosome partition protein Smc n=2 Tax=Caenorhabditis tropicalis TaxID=1561998 RepID=A0A1I7TI19_9PELO
MSQYSRKIEMQVIAERGQKYLNGFSDQLVAELNAAKKKIEKLEKKLQKKIPVPEDQAQLQEQINGKTNQIRDLQKKIVELRKNIEGEKNDVAFMKLKMEDLEKGMFRKKKKDELIEKLKKENQENQK